MHTFFALLFRQKYIRRWGLMRNLLPESLAEHSMQTAVLTHALAVIGNRYFEKKYDEGKAALYALYHDAAEVYTGDLPTPVKYYSEESKESYRKIERAARSALLERLPCELVPDFSAVLEISAGDAPYRKLVKAADKLAAYLKCLEEERCGNPDFKNAAQTLWQAIREADCPELDYFCTHFLDGFSMTLDQI